MFPHATNWVIITGLNRFGTKGYQSLSIFLFIEIKTLYLSDELDESHLKHVFQHSHSSESKHGARVNKDLLKKQMHKIMSERMCGIPDNAKRKTAIVIINMNSY